MQARTVKPDTDEHLLVMHFDDHGTLIGRTRCHGIVGRVSVPLRELIADALGWRSATLMIAHSHPGAPDPSAADIDATRRIARIAHEMGVRVHDHVIVGAQTNFSFRNNGLL